MENLLVALIVGAAAVYLFGRMRKTFSGRGGCGCGCSGGCPAQKRSELPMACASCPSQKDGRCGLE